MINILDIYKNHIREIWWVNITEKSVEVKSVYPQSYEAYEALNILVWYCVWKWMKIRDYKSSDDLLYAMRWPIRELHSIIKNIK